MTKQKSAIAVELGRRGGSATLKKYGKAKMLEWSRKGAKSRRKGVDKSAI